MFTIFASGTGFLISTGSFYLDAHIRCFKTTGLRRRQAPLSMDLPNLETPPKLMTLSLRCFNSACQTVEDLASVLLSNERREVPTGMVLVLGAWDSWFQSTTDSTLFRHWYDGNPICATCGTASG